MKEIFGHENQRNLFTSLIFDIIYLSIIHPKWWALDRWCNPDFYSYSRIFPKFILVIKSLKTDDFIFDIWGSGLFGVRISGVIPIYLPKSQSFLKHKHTR
jgi:hypothetical protein